MKSVKYLVVLVCMAFASVSSFAQEKELKTESDGFQWYRLYQNGKYGAQSMGGITFIPLSRGYTYIWYYSYAGGWFSVEKNGKEGICNITGKEIVAPGRYDDVEYHDDFGLEFCEVELNGRHGICDKNGHEIIAPKYEYVGLFPFGGDRYYYQVNLNGKQGACDMNGREIIAPKYDCVIGYSERDGYYYQIELNGKLGACDVNGREIIAPKYESLVYSKDGVFKYQNASGKWVSTGVSLNNSSSTNYTSTTTTTTTSGGSGQSFEFYFPVYYDFVNKKNIYKDGACTFYTIRFELQPSQIAVKVIECDAGIEADKKENVIESYSISPSKSYLLYTGSDYTIHFLVSGKEKAIRLKKDKEEIVIVYNIIDSDNNRHSFYQNETVNSLHEGLVICPGIKVEHNFQSKSEELLKELRKYSWKK